MRWLFNRSQRMVFVIKMKEDYLLHHTGILCRHSLYMYKYELHVCTSWVWLSCILIEIHNKTRIMFNFYLGLSHVVNAFILKTIMAFIARCDFDRILYAYSFGLSNMYALVYSAIMCPGSAYISPSLHHV